MLKYKPILFSTEMVQAILEGRKTVTRRLIKNIPSNLQEGDIGIIRKSDGKITCYGTENLLYQVGDILYVRETFRYVSIGEETYEGECLWQEDVIEYKASQEEFEKQNYDYIGEYYEWHPSIHMPKSIARIFLKVTDVRVERLQDITEMQVRKEGFRDYLAADDIFYPCGYYFRQTWDSTINKQDLDKYGWEANPWVWVIEFEKLD